MILFLTKLKQLNLTSFKCLSVSSDTQHGFTTLLVYHSLQLCCIRDYGVDIIHRDSFIAMHIINKYNLSL